MTLREQNAQLRQENARLGLALKKAQEDLALLDNCEVCMYGETGSCTAPKDQKMGGSCFVWRGRRATDEIQGGSRGDNGFGSTGR